MKQPIYCLLFNTAKSVFSTRAQSQFPQQLQNMTMKSLSWKNQKTMKTSLKEMEKIAGQLTEMEKKQKKMILNKKRHPGKRNLPKTRKQRKRRNQQKKRNLLKRRKQQKRRQQNRCHHLDDQVPTTTQNKTRNHPKNPQLKFQAPGTRLDK